MHRERVRESYTLRCLHYYTRQLLVSWVIASLEGQSTVLYVCIYEAKSKHALPNIPVTSITQCRVETQHLWSSKLANTSWQQYIKACLTLIQERTKGTSVALVVLPNFDSPLVLNTPHTHNTDSYTRAHNSLGLTEPLRITDHMAILSHSTGSDS